MNLAFAWKLPAGNLGLSSDGSMIRRRAHLIAAYGPADIAPICPP